MYGNNKKPIPSSRKHDTTDKIDIIQKEATLPHQPPSLPLKNETNKKVTYKQFIVSMDVDLFDAVDKYILLQRLNNQKIDKSKLTRILLREFLERECPEAFQ